MALIFTKMAVIVIYTFMMIDHDVDGSGLDLFPRTWTAKEKQRVVIMLVKTCLPMVDLDVDDGGRGVDLTDQCDDY